ncbi:AMP-binding protein [Terricaulis sp.]|uniref:AMP-binding protein n=1 Tax=Terricaulis sp. TaxID=2768686 RepID=UPI003784BB06
MGVDLVDITAKRAALTPARIAFEDALSGRTLTYAQLNDRASRAAGVLARFGVGREDRVAILCRNRIEYFEILFACAKLGAILAPLNWRSPAAELAPLLDDCTPKLLIFGAEDASCALALKRPDLAVLALDQNYEPLLSGAEPLITDLRWAADAIWTLMYTSGTTGVPKAVIQTVQMSLINHVHVTQAFGVQESTRSLNFLPLFHTAGIQLITLPTVIAGGTTIVLPGFDVERAIDIVPSLDVFFGVPAVYQQLALHPRFATSDFSRVRSWGCGGAPLPDALVETYAAKSVRVFNGYGLTETGPTAFVGDPTTPIGSVGKPQMLLEARLVDAQGEDVAVGEQGEFWLRGPGVTPGYWRRPEENARTLTRDGWLKTGDIGRQDANGHYYVAGRIKEMFISGGENVFPAEVENVLARHPAVLEAAVVGVADEKWGEVGHAFVALRPDAARPSDVELTQFCRANLAGYKTPRSFTFVEDFPRTAAGKIRKHLLVPEASARAR